MNASDIHYQWQRSSNATTWDNISSANSASYTVPLATTSKIYYRCVISASDTTVTPNIDADSVTSKYTYVIVNDPYQITLSVPSSDNDIDVGERPIITATLQKFDTDAGKYVDYKTETVSVSWHEDTVDQIATLYSNTTTKSATSAQTTNTLYTYSTGSYTKDTITVYATAKISNTDITSNELKITLNSVSNKDITYKYTTSGVTLNESDFYDVLKTALGSYYSNVGISNFYVVFGTQYGGTLYRDSSSTSSSNKVSTGTYDRYYYDYSSSGNKNYYDLDAVYFLNDSTSTSSRYVYYTVYTSNGEIASGKVYFNSSSADIEYTVAAGGSVTFDSADFNTFVKKAASASSSSSSGYALNYVTFDMKNATFAGYSYSTYNTTRYGDLYTAKTMKTSVSNGDKFYYSPSSYQNDLDDVTFGAGSYTSSYTVTIPFTAVNNNGTSYYGYVYIYVNSGHNITILGADFSSEKIAAEITNDYSDAAYVEFTLPNASYGKLYYNYSTIASYTRAVKSSDDYYLVKSGTKDLVQYVYFVPAADFTGSVSITYTAYNSKGTKLGTGKISFSVYGRTSSDYYTDVTASNTGSWSANAVDFMSYNKLVNGIGGSSFGPNDKMTRAMFVTILYRAAGEPSVSSYSNPFTDVKSGTYYYKAVLWAYAKGVVNGKTAKTFDPNGNIKREEIAAILNRSAGSPSGYGSISSYLDSGKVDSYAESAMRWAVYYGYIKGAGSYLNPTSSATRAEVTVMLYRYLTK
jgi:hypothetical protein